ncbi:MAG: hypothetical protein U9N34_04980, partial [Candidatus Cloacimonadota bacterium]|nr:hypothetical protein [Candidatus Cloacimonadota bacterium]
TTVQISTSTINTTENLKIELYIVEEKNILLDAWSWLTNNKFEYKTYTTLSPTEINNIQTQGTFTLKWNWWAERLGIYRIVIKVYDASNNEIETFTSQPYDFVDTEIVSNIFATQLYSLYKPAGNSDHEKLANLYSSMKNDYQNNKKLLYFAKEGASLGAAGGSLSFLIDLADYYHFTPEGRADWVTIQIHYEAFSGVTPLAVSFKYGITKVDVIPGKEDYTDEWTWNLGGSVVNACAEVTFEEAINEDFALQTNAVLDLNPINCEMPSLELYYGQSVKRIRSYEIKRDVLNELLARYYFNNTLDGLYKAVRSNVGAGILGWSLLSKAPMVGMGAITSAFDGDLTRTQRRTFTIDDGGSFVPPKERNFPAIDSIKLSSSVNKIILESSAKHIPILGVLKKLQWNNQLI